MDRGARRRGTAHCRHRRVRRPPRRIVAPVRRSGEGMLRRGTADVWIGLACREAWWRSGALARDRGRAVDGLAGDGSAPTLAGRTAIVTGGGSGIGQAIARLFAARGARVGIIDVAPADETLAAIRAEGGTASAIACDVSRQHEVTRAFAAVEEMFGPLDVLVNSAGVAHVGTIESTTEDDLDRIYAVNVKGVYNCLKLGVASMKDRGGAILNVASVAATVGIPDRFAYSMSKGAVV